MGHLWFYVENNDKVGPIKEEEMISLIKQERLSSSSYVWTTGFENWKKLGEVDSLNVYLSGSKEAGPSFDWSTVDSKKNIFFIMTGKDRGSRRETLYGPYSMDVVVKLYKGNRINGRSYIWASGMKNWSILAEMSIFEEWFGERPPEIEEIERRSSGRRPFIARMLFHNNDRLYEGVCRDISLGGMQILVSGYPAQLGENISFNAHPDNSEYHFVASGEVVRVLEGDQGFSFRFTKLNDEAKSAIVKYINGESS